MSRESLRRTLEELRTQVANTRFPDAESKTHIEALIAGIERQIQGSEGAGTRETLRDELIETIEQFQSRHPDITATLGRIVSTLSSMGF